MISNFIVFFFSMFVAVVVGAQETPPISDPNVGTGHTQAPATHPSQPPVSNHGQPPHQGVEELLDGSGLVINKNVFTYDGAEGRDPFKVYREYVQPISTGTVTGNISNIQVNGKNIRSVVVPDDIVVQGILYKKRDPIALVVIKGVKGLNKLKINSPIGRNEGKVIDIQPNKIVIEQVKDFDGQKFTEKVVLEVRAKKN